MINKIKEFLTNISFAITFKNVHLKLWEAVLSALVLFFAGMAYQHDFWSGVAVLGFGVVAGIIGWWGRKQ